MMTLKCFVKLSKSFFFSFFKCFYFFKFKSSESKERSKLDYFSSLYSTFFFKKKSLFIVFIVTTLSNESFRDINWKQERNGTERVEQRKVEFYFSRKPYKWFTSILEHVTLPAFPPPFILLTKIRAVFSTTGQLDQLPAWAKRKRQICNSVLRNQKGVCTCLPNQLFYL